MEGWKREERRGEESEGRETDVKWWVIEGRRKCEAGVWTRATGRRSSERLERRSETADEKDALLVRCPGSCSAGGGAAPSHNSSAASVLDLGVYILE